MRSVCELGSFFRRCRAPAAGSCQYCGRRFCSGHGQVLANGEEICVRRLCQEKVSDLRQHMIFREAARARSALGVCGLPGCESPRAGQCSKCRAYYCDRHLHDRDETVYRGLVSFTRRASFCEHCLARRKLWSRT